MTAYASTKVPGCMTFWSIKDNGVYLAVEVCEPLEAPPKNVPFNYAIRFGTLAHGLDHYFGSYYKIAEEDFETQLTFALDNIQKVTRA